MPQPGDKGGMIRVTILYTFFAFLFGTLFASFAQLIADRLTSMERFLGNIDTLERKEERA